MSSSRFVKPFLERISKWEKTLNDLQDILDNWLKMQSTWLYLEPIFSSDDIMRQMPTEGKLFRAVDSIWREAMAETLETPSVITTAKREGLLEGLVEANRKLDVIQKGLNDYLETKMIAFPRFFFLSNDELLEILAETKEPKRVQPHMKKCFDGIHKLEFQDNLDITACLDAKDERIPFEYEACNHKLINPNDSGGNVEKWLVEVEIIMKKVSLSQSSLALMKTSIFAMNQHPRNGYTTELTSFSFGTFFARRSRSLCRSTSRWSTTPRRPSWTGSRSGRGRLFSP